jgi:hypothetical protein
LRGLWKISLAVWLAAFATVCARASQAVAPSDYYWKASPAGNSAQLVTLFCRACDDAAGTDRDIPLVAVLRDTLGDVDSANDRVTDVWLLTYSRPSWEKRVLSAVPFFYWKIGDGPARVETRDQKPLINLSLPQRSSVSTTIRTIVQWTVLDPVSTSVRATSRAYQNNNADHERLHLEEAESYLQSAPATDGENGLNELELNTVIARLELRKRLLGDFVGNRRVAELGEDANLEEERVRERNWELLRQCADKTGLVFEPIDLAGSRNQYAMLWYPLNRTAPPEGVPLDAVWKLLNLKAPYSERSKLQKADTYERTIDGERTSELVPVAVYSLTYPRMPLLMIDFRDGTHLRRHEMTQRAINEITSGVIGISRITNWYYFVGADLYDFYESRRGSAMSRVERLDCYSKFRVALALDRNLDGDLRANIQRRVNSLAVNPLETSARREMLAAPERYALLTESAANEDRQISRRLEKERRSELARYDANKAGQVRDSVFHIATLGVYTHRAENDSVLLTRLQSYRKVDYYLSFLDKISAAGTQPEVAYDSAQIKTAVTELSRLLPEIKARDIRQHAERAIEKLHGLSQDLEVRADCLAALDSIRQIGQVADSGVAADALEVTDYATPVQ